MSQEGHTTASPGRSTRASYLVVVDQIASWRHALPDDGQIIIGRVAECDVTVSDTAVSRQHVRIDMVAGRATVVDLASQNGTLVNNRRISENELVDGDVISIGAAILVFHGPAVSVARVAIVSPAEFGVQLGRELERVVQYGRELALVHLVIGELDRATVEQRLLPHLRALDLVTWHSASELGVLLPETDGEALDTLVSRMLTIIPHGRLGFALAPRDGCDANTLVTGARGAADGASSGRANGARPPRTVDLGDRIAVIADPALVRVFELVDRLAPADLSVLIQGETGTGKEVVATALHRLSPRVGRPLIAINCAALPENLVESELFGHERGAFSGAVTTKPGIFESARGGTVFLDEVGELPMSVQSKLLRVIESRRVTRLGDVRELVVEMRVVAASNRDLKHEIQAGRFRQDLFFRLSGATIWLPPLRDRPREIPVLAHRFVSDACERANRSPLVLTGGAISRLTRHPWPGNVRELRNVCEYLVATVVGGQIEDLQIDEILAGAQDPVVPNPTSEALSAFRPLSEEIEALERTRITEALRSTKGNRTQAARAIAMPLRTFLERLKRYAIDV